MNSKALLASATAVAGFALGWAIKPAPPLAPVGETHEGAPASKVSNPTDVSAATRHRQSRPELPESAPPPAEEPQEATPPTVKIDRAFRDAAFERDRGKLLRLAEALGLTAEQIQQLERMLVEQRRGAPALGKPTANRNAKESLDKLIQAAKESDAQFRATLTPEQVASLEALRSRQIENQTESRAQRHLTELTDRLDLTPKQREDALRALRALSAQTQEKMPAGSELISESSLLPLVSAGQFAGGSVEAMTLLANDPPANDDVVSRFTKLEEIQFKRMHQRLAALSGILTPAQLQQYRTAMEAQLPPPMSSSKHNLQTD